MQSFEVAATLQPGWARYHRAWKTLTPAQCARPLPRYIHRPHASRTPPPHHPYAVPTPPRTASRAASRAVHTTTLPCLTWPPKSLHGRCTNPIFTPDEQLFAAAPYEPSAYLYDGVVALAFAADAAARAQAAADVVEQGAEQGSGGGQQAPAQGTAPSVESRLLDELLRVRFDGASGPVALDAHGDRELDTIRFALESFRDFAQVSDDDAGTSLAYEISLGGSTAELEMVATSVAPVQWIGGGVGPAAQPTDAITHEVRPPCSPPSTPPTSCPLPTAWPPRLLTAHRLSTAGE